MLKIRGSVVALATPFLENGKINFEELGRLLDWHIENKTDAILVLGTTGESSTMSHEEDFEIVEYTLNRVNGKVPVIAGSGSNCTQTMLEKSTDYAKMGVDALLTISPYYIKANDEGMYRHFQTIADSVDVPIILYNVPGRTSCSIPVEVVRKLSEHENIIGIKEASGNLGYASQIARYLRDDFAMYCGNDDIILPMLSLGAEGVISVWANIMPREVHELVQMYFSGNIKETRNLQLKYIDLINALFMEVNPIPIKQAMNFMGMKAGGYRLPLAPMEEKNALKLKEIMKEAGLL